MVYGVNKIRLSATNEYLAESLKDNLNIECKTMNANSDIYFIGLGTNYNNTKNPLEYAVKDIKDLSDAFYKHSPENTFVFNLLDESVKKNNIMNTKFILEDTKINDLVIIAFSGHGIISNDTFYFATDDADYLNPADNCVTFEEIYSLLDSIPARKKIMLIDACFSGEVYDVIYKDTSYYNKPDSVSLKSFILTQGTDNIGLIIQENFINYMTGNGTIVISASQGWQLAREERRWKNGTFTHCILKGLKGEADKDGNGNVSVSELKEYVIKEVEKLSNGSQKPTCRRENIEYDYQIW
jgi:uncharacterized caspase-like protein